LDYKIVGDVAYSEFPQFYRLIFIKQSISQGNKMTMGQLQVICLFRFLLFHLLNLT